MGSVIRLSFVGVFFALIAFVGLHSKFPPQYVLGYLGFCALFLVLMTLLSNYQKRQLAAREQLDPERVYKPNELVLARILMYAQAGFAVITALSLWRVKSDEPGAMVGLVVFGALCGIVSYLKRMLSRQAGAWASMRLRLKALSRQSLDAIISVDPAVGAQPVEVQATYARVESRGENNTHTEVLWRSPVASAEPLCLPDRLEFRVKVAMPADAPVVLEERTRHARRRWHLTVKVSASQTLNFDIDAVDAVDAVDAGGA